MNFIEIDDININFNYVLDYWYKDKDNKTIITTNIIQQKAFDDEYIYVTYKFDGNRIQQIKALIKLQSNKEIK